MSGKIKPPKDLKGYDLTAKRSGKANKANAPVIRAGSDKSPEEMMEMLGFDPKSDMDPLQFMMAIVNDKYDLIYSDLGKINAVYAKGGLSLPYRIECAKSAVRYFYSEKPKMSIEQSDKGGYTESLEQAIASGNERIRTKRYILEEVEKLSPNIPLPDASYPSAFDINKDDYNDVTEEVSFDCVGLNPEGDTEYNPDEDE